MPADSFSGVNHAFRKISGGRHIPVIDGRSYRVLLTAIFMLAGVGIVVSLAASLAVFQVAPNGR